MQKITPFLWFDDQAEEAVNFYTSVFKNSKIKIVTHRGEGAPQQAGTVLTIAFQLEGQDFLALNGGPRFHFTQAISLVVNCEDQEELDTMWEKLSEGGERGENVQCGWLLDKFGLSWQIVPAILPELLSNSAKVEKVLAALWTMDKLDIATLQKAYNS